MSKYVVWVDREHAKLFQFSQDKMERRNFRASHTDHHTHAFDSIDHKHQEKAFFAEVVANLSEAGKLLILGPGVAKHHFQNYLGEHFPKLAKGIIGCETVDHPSDAEIAALARKFFKLGVTPPTSGY